MLPPESFEFLSVPGGRFSAEPERLGGEESRETVECFAGRVYSTELISYLGT